MSEEKASRRDPLTGGRRGLTAAEEELLAALFSLLDEHAARSTNRVDRVRVEEVFRWACVHLADKRGSSIEAAMRHRVRVARICTSMRLDTETVCAALLHDCLDDKRASLDEVHAAFGAEIGGLVGEVTKLASWRFRPRDEAQAEACREVMVTTAGDTRVILIKLACRLDSMRRISAMPKQHRIEEARETLDIYAPVANRLGVHRVASELEDLSFQTLHARKYNEIKGLVGQGWDERERYLKHTGEYLAKRLDEFGVEAEISGHLKRLYAVYLEMTENDRTFNEIFDLIALRVIVISIKDCYGAVGAIHSFWKPLPGLFKDLIAMPTHTAYPSLHTTVIGPEGSLLEIEVRAREMHPLLNGPRVEGGCR